MWTFCLGTAAGDAIPVLKPGAQWPPDLERAMISIKAELRSRFHLVDM
jgi:hypothetical protein